MSQLSRHNRKCRALSVLAALALATTLPSEAWAAEIDGATLGVAWALPFVGLLLSIAPGPLLCPHFWEHHYGKIAAVWAALVVVPMLLLHRTGVRQEALLHTLLLEYLSFIILLFALFTIAGGILVAGNLHGTPLTNAGMLAIGSDAGELVGTTGASMIMIRPMIRANDNRPFNAHVFVFFIFLVSNIGGALTPLGDPPLFVGFLRGVDFFWTTTAICDGNAVRGAVVLAAVPRARLLISHARAGCRRSRIRLPTTESGARARATCRCSPASSPPS